ncbi:MAG: glycerol-3-phosphate cytidylyltransferase [Rhodospirillaceae bacterium]|nr:glycerol-3-phosphate cytidylyltransferase [Rhodospirillaceae bacterium]|tara:strand:- start:5662 stop:6075 length:414 start_codon:yes stop_codon:yes gene_type:complete
MKKIITFGTFDLFHLGHLKILERAKEMGDYLIVGVSSDELNWNKKQKFPIFPCDQRQKIVGALKCVDEVFVEEVLDKEDYCRKYGADIFVIGDDWEGKPCGKEGKTFDEQLEGVCQVHYMSRTPSISTTEIIERIRE